MTDKFERRLQLCALAFILCITTMIAQEKQLTLQELTAGGKNYSNFVPQTLRQLGWVGEEYLYVKEDGLRSAAPGYYEEIVSSLSSLNNALKESSLPTLSSLPSFSIPDKDAPILLFTNKGKRILFDYKKNSIEAVYELKESWANFDYSPQSGWLAFTEGNNIQILSAEGEHRIVTNEEKEDIVNGQAVHQREFGIRKGLFWSTKGNSLAFYRMDESMVTDYPIVDFDQRIAEAKPIKYPMAGMKSHEVKVGIYHITSGKTVWLNTFTAEEESSLNPFIKERYFTNIAWSPDEKHIYMAELNREQNEYKLVRYNAETGDREAVLFTETNERYVEPLEPMLFLPSGKQFIWQSQRDGYNHIYLYNLNGEVVKDLTPGTIIVLRTLGFDSKGQNIFISATDNDGMNVNTWKVNINTGKRVQLTKEEGVHSSMLSANGNYIIDNYSAHDVPRVINIINTRNGRIVRNLLTAENPYKDYILPEITIGQIKAADGKTDLNYRLTKPVGFDESKKYPVVVYVYGGPHNQLISNRWMSGARGWDIYMAQLGYVVFSLDNRGSANRGFEFESVIHRNLGVHEMNDQVEGTKFLSSLPFVDKDRIGVFGWSYGGFMATNLMLTYPEIFKVGVAGGPVIEWAKYEIMYGERYMDHPDKNTEGYNNSDLKLRAGDLKGRLLIIHGALDPVVVWQHSLGFLKASIEANTYPDYFVYPVHQHNVIGKDRPHLDEKVTRYFEDFLK